MSNDERLAQVSAQFTRTADVYTRLPQTTDQPSLDAMVRLSGTAPGHRVLDVACGPGFLTRTFARVGATAIGLDATEHFLAFARAEAVREGLESVEFRAGDAEALPFGDGVFDIVACRAAFHHFPRPERVLAEMRRVARPNGRLLIGDLLGGEDPERAAYRDHIERLIDPTHAAAISPSRFERLFAEAGLRVVVDRHAPMDWDATEWIGHGAPGDVTTQHVLALLEASIDGDRTGLTVRWEEGRLRVTYQRGVFLAERAEIAGANPAGS